jgi:hypothetical protein
VRQVLEGLHYPLCRHLKLSSQRVIKAYQASEVPPRRRNSDDNCCWKGRRASRSFTTCFEEGCTLAFRFVTIGAFASGRYHGPRSVETLALVRTYQDLNTGRHGSWRNTWRNTAMLYEEELRSVVLPALQKSKKHYERLAKLNRGWYNEGVYTLRARNQDGETTEGVPRGGAEEFLRPTDLPPAYSSRQADDSMRTKATTGAARRQFLLLGSTGFRRGRINGELNQFVCFNQICLSINEASSRTNLSPISLQYHPDLAILPVQPNRDVDLLEQEIQELPHHCCRNPQHCDSDV